MKHCRHFPLAALLLPLGALAQETVLFETDFDYLPDHWFSEEFTFSSSGARLYWISLEHLSARVQTGETEEWEQNIFIPDGTDSVLIEIEHYIHVSGGDHPTLTFSIRLGDRDSVEYIWYEYLNHTNPDLTGSFNHSICPDWLQEGDWLGIRFRASGWPGEFGSIIEWKLFQVKVTAFGDLLGLSTNTWAGIKASL